jgi:hypothetical protein
MQTRSTSKRLVASLAVLVLASFAGAAFGQGLQIQRVDAGLIAKGAIDAESVERLETALRSGDKLLIGSRSGDPAAALRLARLIRQRQAQVQVSGECLEACANYVFLLAPARSARLGFSVQYSPSPFLMETAVRARPELFSAAERERLETHVREYATLLDEAGVPRRLVACIDSAFDARPQAVGREAGQADQVFERGVVIPTGVRRVVVSQEVLTGFDQQVGGDYDWAPDQDHRQNVSELYEAAIGWIDSPAQCATR